MMSITDSHRDILTSIANVYFDRLDSRAASIVRQRTRAPQSSSSSSTISFISESALRAILARCGSTLRQLFVSKRNKKRYLYQYDGSDFDIDIEQFCRLCANDETIAWLCKWNRLYLPFRICLPCCKIDRRRFICALREAVLDRDWHHVGSIIGDIDLIRVSQKVADRRVYYRFILECRSFTVYIGTIWRCGIQRLLQHRCDDKLIAKSIGSFLSFIVQLEHSNHNTAYRRSTLVLSFVDTLIYLLARGLTDEASQLIRAAESIDLRYIDTQYHTIFQAYTALFAFQCWKAGNKSTRTTNETIAQNALTRCLNLLYSFDDGQGVTLLEAAFSIMISIERHETAIDVCIEFCERYSHLIDAVYQIIERYNHDECEHFLDSLLSNRDIAISSSDRVWLHWTRQRLANVRKYGNKIVVLSECFRSLMELLDYGEHVDTIEIWQQLDVCLSKMTLHESIIKSYWNDRHDWWPAFHHNRRLVSSIDVVRIRQSVIAKLERSMQYSNSSDSNE